MFIRIVLACGLAASATVAESQSGAYFRNSGGQALMGNAQIELAFNAANGVLLNITDKTTGQSFLTQQNVYWNGFTFSYTAPGKPALQYASGALAQAVTFTPASTANGIQVTIQFAKFAVNGSPLNVAATLTIVIDNVSPLTTWRLAIANQDEITIRSVVLPYLAGIRQLSSDPSKDYVTYPSWSGMLFQDPIHNFVPNRGWGLLYYPGWMDNMQFLAYYSLETGAGLYIASQDTAGYTKYLDSVPASDNGWLSLDCTYLPTFQGSAGVTVPYPVVVGVFHGDWYDAASLYRTWAIQQKWAQAGPLVTRADVPTWYKNLGVMSWKDTITGWGPGNSYASLSQAAAVWQRELQTAVAMDWIGWENQGPWLDIPDFLPPSQGWPAFDSTVADTHAAGGRVMVVPTTNYATVGAPSWGSLQAGASQQADGSMYLSQISVPNQSGQSVNETIAQMDPTKLWHDALVSLATQLGQHGVDLIQMDGNPGQTGICYASSHPHPPGGGDWWFQDYAQIYADVRAAGRTANPDFAMGGEGYAEPFLNLTDSGWDATSTGLDPSAIGDGSVSDHTKASFIPLWQAVYHDYTLTYGMIAMIDGQYMPYYRRGLGIELVWGEIPMFEGDDGLPYTLARFDPTMVQYLQRIVTLRTTYGYRFVVLGRMLRPPQPSVPKYYVPPATNIPYTAANTSGFYTPSILSGAFQSPEGDAALIFTNVSDDPVSFSWTVSASDVPLDPKKAYTLYIVRNGACAGTQAGVTLPYTLNVNANSTDIVMALFSQAGTGGTAVFPGCESLPPVITSVENGASFQTAIAPATWITIMGANFGPASPQLWSATDFNGVALPISLGGVHVSVDGKPAYVEYVSSAQINAIAPDDTATGVVSVEVTTPAGQTCRALATLNATSPALFTMGSGGKYAAAVHADGAYVGPPGLLGPGVVSRPAQPGEIISVYGTGFGQTTPPTPTDKLVETPAPLAGTPIAQTGPATAAVVWAGIVSSGEYQFNIRIPTLPGGDVPITIQIAGAQTQAGVYITIGGN